VRGKDTWLHTSRRIPSFLELILEVDEFTIGVIVNSLPSVEPLQKVPTADSSPHGIWEIDVHIVRQADAALQLVDAQDTAFREANFEEASKKPICSRT